MRFASISMIFIVVCVAGCPAKKPQPAAKNDAAVTVAPPPTPSPDAQEIAVDPSVASALDMRTQGGSGAGSGSAAAETDVDAGVEAAIKRKRAMLGNAVASADANAKKGEQDVANSDRGTKEQRAAAVKALQAGWQHGHSPQANALFDGEADAEINLKKKIAKARKKPAGEAQEDIAKALEEFPGDADRATQDAQRKASENQMVKLLEAAAPLAVFAGCLALGGGAVCGVIASFGSKLFGNNPGTQYSTQLGDVLNDIPKILDGSCDLACLLGLVGDGPNPPTDEALEELFKGLGGTGRDYAKYHDAVTRGARDVKKFIACAKDVTDPVRDILSSEKCRAALKSVGIDDPTIVLPKLEAAKCVEGDDRDQGLCIQVHVK